jgi:hypothetical protein
LTAHVHYERWACVKAFGKNVVKRLVGGNAVVVVKLTPSAGADGISMASEVQKIDADGSLGEVLQSGSFWAPAVKEKIAGSIESSIRKGLDLKSTLPPAAASAATLRSAQFVSGAEGPVVVSRWMERCTSPPPNFKERIGVRRGQSAGGEEPRHLLLRRQANQYRIQARELHRGARNADEQRQERMRVLRQRQPVRQRDIVPVLPSPEGGWRP